MMMCLDQIGEMACFSVMLEFTYQNVRLNVSKTCERETQILLTAFD